jgi:hypothetical protein
LDELVVVWDSGRGGPRRDPQAFPRIRELAIDAAKLAKIELTTHAIAAQPGS